MLISNWKKVYKFWSVKLAVLGSIITSVLITLPEAALYIWNTFPEDLKQAIPQEYTPLIGVFVFVLSIVGRVIKQNIGDDNE